MTEVSTAELSHSNAPERILWAYDLNKLLGHSSKLPEKHYRQVTDEHWRKARELPAPPVVPEVAPISNNLEPSEPIIETKKPCDLQGLDGAGWLLKLNLVTPTGSEQYQKNAANSSSSAVVPTLVPTKLVFELLKTLSRLGEEKLRSVLEFAISQVIEPHN